MLNPGSDDQMLRAELKVLLRKVQLARLTAAVEEGMDERMAIAAVTLDEVEQALEAWTE